MTEKRRHISVHERSLNELAAAIKVLRVEIDKLDAARRIVMAQRYNPGRDGPRNRQALEFTAARPAHPAQPAPAARRDDND